MFNSLDHWLYEKQKMYAKRTHRNKSDIWRQAKYWGNRGEMSRRDLNWSFRTWSLLR
ncbi:hypothetical protein LC608_35700 [Nostoc sp. XA010]|nr:hypothetical protein [Nostoc sp. XA010]